MLDTASHDEIREALTCPSKGFFVIRGFYSVEEITRYREECEEFCRRAPMIYARINTDTMADYVHPRSYDDEERTYRLYQYLHNRHSPDTGRILEMAITMRNAIEETWMADEEYRRATQPLQDHMVVTRYVPGAGRLPVTATPATAPSIHSCNRWSCFPPRAWTMKAASSFSIPKKGARFGSWKS